MITDDRLRALTSTTAVDSVSYVETRMMAAELLQHRAERVQLQDENLGLREDLKKVDDLHKLVDSLTGAVEKLSERYVDMTERYAKLSTNLHERIDKVAEIIGERVSGLVDEIAAVRDSAKRAHERLELINPHNTAAPSGGWGPAGGYGAFPTGGSTTAEAAAEAVLPVPQRGDRVRLEGAKALGAYPVPDSWYDVAGQNGGAFQIRVPQFGGDWLPYIGNETAALKEVRHADQR